MKSSKTNMSKPGEKQNANLAISNLHKTEEKSQLSMCRSWLMSHLKKGLTPNLGLGHQTAVFVDFFTAQCLKKYVFSGE